MGAASWMVAAFAGFLAVGVLGCSEDDTGTPPGGDPFLQVRVNSFCDQNTLPVTTPAELQAVTMERAVVSVSGGDPTRSSGELLPGTQVFMYVGKDGKPGGEGGSFLSTLGEDSLTGEPQTADVAFASSTVADEFFCTKKGVHQIFAGVKKYDPTGKSIIMPANEGFPVRCIDHDQWMCDCRDLCGPQDAALPDAALPDAMLPDIPIPDVPIPDMDRTDAILPDMLVAPTTWQITYDSPVEEEKLRLRVRVAAVPAEPGQVLLKWKILDSGEPRPGIRVDFELVDPGIADVVLNPEFGISNAEGLVGTIVQAGNTPGQIKIRATAQFPTRDPTEFDEGEEVSPALTISSGLPSLTEFHFVCADSVMAAFSVRTYDTVLAPPSGDRWVQGINAGTVCYAGLADRLKNRIPAGTQVRFTTEAGSVNAVDATDEGAIAETTLVLTVPPPKDVEPLPYEGVDHPSPGPGIVWNPRDGLVRMVASTRGEEGFTDTDGDKQFGQFDILGPADDIGEPFVDVNDNNAHDESEEFDDVNQNGSYDPPNDTWDADTVIWRSALVLWHGPMSVARSYFGYTRCEIGTPGCDEGCVGNCSIEGEGGCRDSGADINFSALRGPTTIELVPVDQNGNCLDSREVGTMTVTARSLNENFGEPTFVESDSASFDREINHCFKDGLPEQPIGGGHYANLFVELPPPDEEDPPDHVRGLLTFDVSFQRADQAPVTVTVFRTYCAEFRP